MKRISHWIDGKVAAGTSGRSGKVFNPATGEVQAEVDFADVSEIDIARMARHQPVAPRRDHVQPA